MICPSHFGWLRSTMLPLKNFSNLWFHNSLRDPPYTELIKVSKFRYFLPLITVAAKTPSRPRHTKTRTGFVISSFLSLFFAISNKMGKSLSPSPSPFGCPGFQRLQTGTGARVTRSAPVTPRNSLSRCAICLSVQVLFLFFLPAKGSLSPPFPF